MSGWGLGYFRVNAEGHVTVHPDANRKRGLDLYQLAMDLDAQGVGLPLLLRFSDILQLADRGAARASSQNAIKEFGYRAATPPSTRSRSTSSATWSRRSWSSARRYGVGLECGSKPELQAVLGLNESTDHLIVCNGYKDEEFMRLALMGQKLGPQGDHRARAAQRARRAAQGGRRDGRAARRRASASSSRPRARAAGPRAAARDPSSGSARRS